MSNTSNENHRNYCVRMIQLMDFAFSIYQQLRPMLVRQIEQIDAQRVQRRADEHDERDRGDTYMEDVVMGGTSPD
ncbi:uncharacterized protein TrAtP1_008423 [Trichoderma atroviride]|uniref:uncharacterized protein n=1 Tax=Hypocrea atroviridis TaxID=63577 RepID=UPI00332436D8|nr:hypothetical protein TrAtP1_008423 [Trichoderma atroviride]